MSSLSFPNLFHAAHVKEKYMDLLTCTHPFPNLSSGRVKYTSLAVSPDFVLLGSNTGSLYVYERASHRFVQLSNEGSTKWFNHTSIKYIRFSPDSELLAIATDSPDSCVYICQHNFKERGKLPQVVKKLLFLTC